MRYFFTTLLIIGGLGSPAQAAPRPNIILIMCDDMGWSDIGCYGGEVQTPHLDQLADEGLRFTQFYNNSKCTTTRASLLTGLYPRQDNRQLLRTNMVTIGEALKAAGYQTALSGKWHLGDQKTTHPYHRGFDEFYGLLDGCCNAFDPSRRDPPYKGGKIRKYGHNDQSVTEFPDDYYTTDAFTNHAIECVKKFAANDQPFLIHLNYTAPHYPLHAKPEDIQKYIGNYRKIGGWFQLRQQRWDRIRAMGLATDSWKLSDRDSEAYDWDSANQDHEDLRQATYAAMIDRMDQNIGRLLSTLKQQGVADNTLIIFLSDNGGCAEEPGGRRPENIPGPKEHYTAVGPSWGWAQNAPFKRYKVNMHEGGICTPCIAWWPGKIKAGEITRQPAHIIDFMPTFLELAGSNYPETYNEQAILPVEGKSIVPILYSKDAEPHAQLAWAFAGNRALRQGDWKIVWDRSIKQWELYNLADDRCETIDLAAADPERTRQMAEAWITWAKHTGVKTKTKAHNKRNQ